MATDDRTPDQKNFVWNSNAKDSEFIASFPKAPDMELILIGSELYQNPEEHDRLILHYKGKPATKKNAIISGDPIIFTYRSGKLTSTWNGYVHHVRQDNSFQGGNTDIVCVGASWVLKDTDQKVYKNVTADQVISKIVKKHSMQAVTQRDPRVRSQISQSGQSDWQLCRSLAKQTGFALLAENTTITFVSKNKIYQSKKSSAPYFNYVDNENSAVTPGMLRMTGTILSFEPMISDQAPEKGARLDRVISGSNTNTGAAIKTTHVHPSPTAGNSGVVIPNKPYFAQRISNG
jgi:hypothetical protein